MTTRLTLLANDDARRVLFAALGAEPQDLAGIADLIRDEVSAHGTCQRAATLRRVARRVTPALALDESLVADVCDLLVREGDAVLGPGGVLFATPLRAVDLGGGCLRIASSFSTRRLTDWIVGTWQVVGTSRTCRVENEERARAAVVAAGGVVLTPGAWACLDRVPPADQAWLDQLDRRLRVVPELPSSLERDEALTWAGCVADAAGVRWRTEASEPSKRLWRARNRWGRWHFAWTQAGTPATAAFVSLRQNEAARTTYALAAALGAPVVATATREEKVVLLSVPNWLPTAEYRFLATEGSLLGVDRGTSRWSIPTERSPSVFEVLRKRLGLVVREEANR